MIIEATCKKCGIVRRFDIGDQSKKDVIEHFTKGTYTCLYHVELGPPIDYLKIDWDSLTEGTVPSEDEFKRQLVKEHGAIFSTEEFTRLGVKCFTAGMAFLKDGRCFSWNNSPENKRYYYELRN